MGTMGIYKPLYVWCSPASIPQIVAHIQDYLVKNPIVSTETVAEIVVQSLQEHPELINGSVIPITEDSAQTIKEYIDALPLLDGYTKAETDALLLLKQNLLIWDQTPTAGSSNPVTSEGIKAAISATAAALADLISTKADIASVYTKSVMDTLLIQKADVATTYSKNAVDALLDTKVDINDTYTKADIDLMKQVDKANTAIVSSTDGTAPLNIAAGQYVYLNDILYMATQAIPENDPLVPGTNIVLTPKGVANNIGDGLQNLARTVSTQSDQIAYLQNGIAYVENGDTVQTTGGIPQYAFLMWKGILYQTKTALIYGSTITVSNLTAIDIGVLNTLTNFSQYYIDSFDSASSVQITEGGLYLYRYGPLILITAVGKLSIPALNQNTYITVKSNLPSEYISDINYITCPILVLGMSDCTMRLFIENGALKLNAFAQTQASSTYVYTMSSLIGLKRS